MKGPVRRILVIKLGGLSDFVMSFGAFSAIRRHHADAHVTLLTVKSFAELARKSGWFDEVRENGAPAWTRPGKVLKLIRRLRRGGFDLVYDLENTPRSARYRALSTALKWNPPAWSRGVDDGTREHVVERLARQLAEAGVTEMPMPDLSWMIGGFGGRFGLKDGYVLIAPGGARAEPGKRWPPDRYAELARRVAIEGRRPVIIGTEADTEIARVVAAASPDSMNLVGRTTLFDLAALAAHAKVAVGNDIGAMHLIAAVGCSSAVLFSAASDTALRAPRGRYVVMLRESNLADLPVSEVAAALRLR